MPPSPSSRNEIALQVTCVTLLGGTADAPLRSYTATDTTLTFFIRNSAYGNPNPDRIEVFTRQ
jgi:hypothetical protein